jgi:hypothetical protein
MYTGGRKCVASGSVASGGFSSNGLSLYSPFIAGRTTFTIRCMPVLIKMTFRSRVFGSRKNSCRFVGRSTLYMPKITRSLDRGYHLWLHWLWLGMKQFSKWVAHQDYCQNWSYCIDGFDAVFFHLNLYVRRRLIICSMYYMHTLRAIRWNTSVTTLSRWISCRTTSFATKGFFRSSKTLSIQ